MTTPFASVETLGELASVAASCTDCQLCETRNTVVFGQGAENAEVMIVGEAPGAKEDELGVPFVGRSGQLLDKLLLEVGFERPDVYISNVVKCRPPRNRDPRQDEIDACKGYLRAQIQFIDPTVVITLGNFSSKLLLRTTTGITRLRGTAYEWWGRHLVPTFHPAAALRGGERVTNDIRSDLALVRTVVDGNLESAANDQPTELDRLQQDIDGEVQLDMFGE